MERTSPSIRDVARAAGVSVATVSRVLSGSPGVGSETRKQIEALIQEMGYRPSLTARGLARRNTGNVAVMTPRGSALVFSNPFFLSLLEGIGQELDQAGFNLILSFTPPQYQRLVETRAVDGILVFAARIGDPYLDRLESSGVPVVVLGSYLPESPFPCVRPDDTGGIYAMVTRLHELGHRRFALVNGPLSSVKSQRCQEGFLKACADHGLAADQGLLVADEFDQGHAYRLVSALLGSPGPRPTALVCTSDFLAIGALKAALDQGLRVPGDISVTGFGDVPLAAYLNPPLTTVRTDVVGIGRRGARTLLAMMNGEARRRKEYVFKMQLVERGTTAPPAAESR